MKNKIECSDTNPPVIIVATEQSLRELKVKRFLSTFSIKSMFESDTSLVNIISRLFGSSSELKFKNIKKMSYDEKILLFLRLYTGANLDIPRYLPNEVQKKFEFEGGYMPQDGEVFFNHTYRKNRYLFPATANIKLAKEKLYVFIRLAGALGAKTITLKSGVVRSKNWRGKAKLPIDQAAAQLGMESSFSKDSSNFAYAQATFGKPEKSPFVPEDLDLWVKYDDDFETMVKSRFESRICSQNISLELKENEQYSSGIIGKYDKIGFEIGGKIESMVHSVWKYEIEYWPI